MVPGMSKWTIQYVGGREHREVCDALDQSLRERYIRVDRPKETRWEVETAEPREGVQATLDSVPWGGPGGQAPSRWFFLEEEGGDLGTSVRA